MAIRVDGQTFTPRALSEMSRIPVAAVGRATVEPSAEAQDLLDAMALCAALTQPEVKRGVGSGMLTMPNPISAYGVKRLVKVHAALERSLDRHLTGEDLPKRPVRLRPVKRGRKR